MREWRNAAELLKAAGDLVQQKGWSQRPEASSSKVCAATALEAAFKGSDFSVADFQHAVRALEMTLGASSTAPPAAAADEPPYWGAALVEWNDSHGRTEQDVVGALRRAGENIETRLSE